MRIRILNKETCSNCKNHTCTYTQTSLLEDFFSLRSEATVCPVGILDRGIGPCKTDHGYLAEEKCILCGLCANSCYLKNLLVEDVESTTNSFDNLLDVQYNAIALSYLHTLFDFAANTNRNKSITFDGYVRTRSGDECFVEVDWGNDSLESCRRILGDIILHTESHKINKGLIVLRDIPVRGNRDVFQLIDRILRFPGLENTVFYFTTFAILRKLSFLLTPKVNEFDALFFRASDSFKTYKKKLESHGITL